jgi:hypothetical protein
MLELADDGLKAVNSKIVEIQNRATELGVTDLALKFSSLGPEDIFRVPLGHKCIKPSSNGNGRPVVGQAILNTPT